MELRIATTAGALHLSNARARWGLGRWSVIVALEGQRAGYRLVKASIPGDAGVALVAVGLTRARLASEPI